jgi:14-3-3 protein epsilon
LESYSSASAIALKDLSPSHPVRLGVALNFSVFYHEILHSHDLACEIAKKAFDAAFVELNSISDDWNKETTTIMQLIKENLVLWMANEGITVEDHDDGEGEEGDGGQYTEV